MVECICYIFSDQEGLEGIEKSRKTNYMILELIWIGTWDKKFKSYDSMTYLVSFLEPKLITVADIGCGLDKRLH